MSELARKMPGYISHKPYVAEDAERLTLFEWGSAETLRAWASHPEHVLTKKLGRERFYVDYHLQVCEVVRESRFARGGETPTAERQTKAPVATSDLSAIYRDYIACLNRQDWAQLGQFVHDNVRYNGRRVQLAGYRKLLEGDFDAIPDLSFHIQLLACDPPFVASRLHFDCTPKGDLFGLAVNGRKVSFAENVFYEFKDKKIANVWSIIDRAAIEAQL